MRMPFGLRNAPARFQRCMDRALGHLLGSTSTYYIDDVLVFSNSWEEHLVHVRQVLEALAEIGLTAKPTKCVWGARSLSYLGHMIGAGYTSVPEARIKAFKQYHRPVSKKDLRAFGTRLVPTLHRECYRTLLDVIKNFFVIERTRDLIYLKFVATDLFPKIISPSAGENSGVLA